ncbi:peptidylprolyl isomerase [Candidatus Pelagibacter sp.]|nr:peptidylprolyl isomerase [Candidatus Pelagibacter sp.]
MKLFKVIFLIILNILFFEKIKSQDNISIVFKVNNEIITNRDVQNEVSYLSALNSQFQNLTKEKKFRLAKESILKETIKKNEILKYYILDQKDPLLEKVIQNFIVRLKLNNKAEFETHLLQYNLNIKTVIKKIEVETVWNQLIYRNYKNLIKIDKEELTRKIKKQTDKKKLLLLSEIIFKKNNNEKLDETIKKIYNSIDEIGFQNTANIYSVSDSSKFGGQLGWVNSQNLSNKILKEIKKINLNENTIPINITNGFLILKLEDIKEEKIEVNLKEELNKAIMYETDKQLNIFSKIYFDTIKINTNLNEL